MMNFLGTWKTDKGNIVVVSSKQIISDFWIGQHYRYNPDAKSGSVGFAMDNSNCLIDPTGTIIVGEIYSIGEKLVTAKRSEEEKGWPI